MSPSRPRAPSMGNRLGVKVPRKGGDAEPSRRQGLHREVGLEEAGGKPLHRGTHIAFEAGRPGQACVARRARHHQTGRHVDAAV